MDRGRLSASGVVQRLRNWITLSFGLRQAALLAIAVGTLLPALAFLATENQFTRKTQYAMLMQAVHGFASISATAVAEPLWTINPLAIRDSLQGLMDRPVVMAVRLEDALGVIDPIELRKPGVTALLVDGRDLPGLQYMSVPVRREGQQLGILHLWLDGVFLDKMLNPRRYLVPGLILMQALLTFGVLYLLLARRVIQPIEQLKRQASQLADDPDAVDDHDWRRRDELGQLGRHLKQVRERLRRLIGELRARNEQLEQMALYDQLTGLPNRILFRDLVARELAQAQRRHSGFAIVFVDLDRFKVINDALGHAAGDALLSEVGQRLRLALRDVDVVCRHSGDEFLLMVRSVRQRAELHEVAARLLAALEPPAKLDTEDVKVSASLGIAVYPEDGADFETLVKHADVAMYQAKLQGRARYGFYHADLTQPGQRLGLQQELLRAIDENQLVLHYQPLVDAGTDALVGVEALVRWQHPQRGLLAPAEFIPTAEEWGLIGALDRWVLHAACRQLAHWRSQHLVVPRVAVNVSAIEFRDPELPEKLQADLGSCGLKPQDLEIEITESVLMSDTQAHQSTIERLRQLGVALSVDDFGTGYSSLAYLKRLRPQRLKIDRSFICDIEQDDESRAIVRGIIDMGRALGLEVLAEGVETEAQRSFLQAHGCATLQGYLLGRPMPAEALAGWCASALISRP